MDALTHPSALLSAGLAAVPDWAYHVSGAHLAAAQLLALVIGILPASALAIAAGATLGVGMGFGLSSATLLVGATVTFLLSRSLVRPLIKRWVGGRARAGAFDEALGRQGWRIVCLMRVSPAAPFVLTSYLLGLSKVSFRDYIVGTLAALPALLGYVVVGDLAASGVRSAVAQNWIGGALLGVGILATVLLTAKVGRIIARALKATPSETQALAARD